MDGNQPLVLPLRRLIKRILLGYLFRALIDSFDSFQTFVLLELLLFLNSLNSALVVLLLEFTQNAFDGQNFAALLGQIKAVYRLLGG